MYLSIIIYIYIQVHCRKILRNIGWVQRERCPRNRNSEDGAVFYWILSIEHWTKQGRNTSSKEHLLWFNSRNIELWSVAWQSFESVSGLIPVLSSSLRSRQSGLDHVGSAVGYLPGQRLASCTGRCSTEIGCAPSVASWANLCRGSKAEMVDPNDSIAKRHAVTRDDHGHPLYIYSMGIPGS